MPFVLLDLEDTAGGNSRPGQLQGIACPLGAHYLPVPGDPAREVQDLLEDLGVRKRVAGRWTYDERMQCHAPQERLYFQGQWQAGLLPLNGVGATTLAQYTLFSREVELLRASGPSGPFASTRTTDHQVADRFTESAGSPRSGARSIGVCRSSTSSACSRLDRQSVRRTTVRRGASR